MNNTILVKMTMPSETIFDAQANMVNIPGTDGVFGVLPGHVKLISQIAIGCVSIFLGEQEKKFFIYKGIAQITSLEVNIVSEFIVDLAVQKKNDILNKIVNFQAELEQSEKNSLNSHLLNDVIIQYNSLLSFMGN